MRIGSLFTGYGGLDLAVEAFFDADLAWYAEIEKAASPAEAETKFRRALRVNGEMTIVSVAEGGPVTEETVRIV